MDKVALRFVCAKQSKNLEWYLVGMYYITSQERERGMQQQLLIAFKWHTGNFEQIKTKNELLREIIGLSFVEGGGNLFPKAI